MLRYRAAIAYVVVISVVLWGTYRIQQSAIEREHDAQVVACKRVQTLRDQANGTNFLVYDTFKSVAAQQSAVLELPGLTAKERMMAQKALKRANDVVRTTVVTGPTSCVDAVDHPDSYSAPAPEFIASDSKRVAIARKRAQIITQKAKTNTPLYGPVDQGD